MNHFEWKIKQLLDSAFVWSEELCRYLRVLSASAISLVSALAKQKSASKNLGPVDFATVLAVKKCYRRWISTAEEFYREYGSNLDHYLQVKNEIWGKRTFVLRLTQQTCLLLSALCVEKVCFISAFYCHTLVYFPDIYLRNDVTQR